MNAGPVSVLDPTACAIAIERFSPNVKIAQPLSAFARALYRLMTASLSYRPNPYGDTIHITIKLRLARLALLAWQGGSGLMTALISSLCRRAEPG